MTFAETADKHIIVNYHYVRDNNPDFSGIHPCAPAIFEKQVAWLLQQKYTIVSIPEIFEAATKNAPDKLATITFDDGLKDQYENAVPILQKHNATATFFPITGTLDGFLPATHKIHILLSRSSAEDLVDRCNNFFDENYPELALTYRIPKNRRISETRKLRDDILTANFKETMNILPNEVEGECLETLFANLKINEREMCETLFMSERDISHLAHDGFTVGSHGHKHYALEFQDVAAAENDIRTAKERLTKIIGIEPKIFSYPHGGASDQVVKILKDETFTHAVTIERRSVSQTDNTFLIPRYDTKDLKTV